MQKKLCVCIAERFASAAIGGAALVVGFLLVVLGLTFLPIIGIIIAIPFLAISCCMFNPEVKVSVDEKEAAAAVHEEAEDAWVQPGAIRAGIPGGAQLEHNA